MTDSYAVIGNPVAHSRSPFIHEAFARQTGEPIAYTRILAPLEGFSVTVARFRAEGGRGANVTLPFKEDACRLAGSLSDRAREAQAVNTLRFDGAIFGDNTDGPGLVRDIRANLGVELAGRRLLVLGAGGAVRGILAPLLAQEPAELILANRTLGKAAALAQRHGAVACGYEALAGRSFDVIINGTSVSIAGATLPLPTGLFAGAELAYDLMYGQHETPFLARAREEGAARVADGLGMLVEQAAESFFVWRGVRPRTGSVLDALRAAIDAERQALRPGG